MAEIVNLRTERKRRERADKERAAAANRALFGRSKAERAKQSAETARTEKNLSDHRRELDADV